MARVGARAGHNNFAFSMAFLATTDIHRNMSSQGLRSFYNNHFEDGE
jgi:hypothetical protein